LFYQTMSMHQLLLFVGTKLPIAMVGPQIILAMDKICSGRRFAARLVLEIDVPCEV
jgi:hypothetical protein